MAERKTKVKVSVYFEDLKTKKDMDIYYQLVEIAKIERRTLNAQVIHFLEESIKKYRRRGKLVEEAYDHFFKGDDIKEILGEDEVESEDALDHAEPFDDENLKDFHDDEHEGLPEEVEF